MLGGGGKWGEVHACGWIKKVNDMTGQGIAAYILHDSMTVLISLSLI
jgi:hypothetical protein